MSRVYLCPAWVRSAYVTRTLPVRRDGAPTPGFQPAAVRIRGCPAVDAIDAVDSSMALPGTATLVASGGPTGLNGA